MNAAVTQVMTPMDLCNLITHETVALLYGADGDGIDTAEELRDAMKVYAAACGLEDDVSVHLAWIDSELASARQFADTGEDTPHLLDPDRLIITPNAAMQVELLWSIFRAAVGEWDAQKRKSLLELAIMVTDMGGLEDKLLYGEEPSDHSATCEDYQRELEEVQTALSKMTDQEETEDVPLLPAPQ